MMKHVALCLLFVLCSTVPTVRSFASQSLGSFSNLTAHTARASSTRARSGPWGLRGGSTANERSTVRERSSTCMAAAAVPALSVGKLTYTAAAEAAVTLSSAAAADWSGDLLVVAVFQPVSTFNHMLTYAILVLPVCSCVYTV
jgi:hypothetical protein